MHDFFISYTGVDRRWADWIAGVLERVGHTCIYQDSAELGTRPGENFVAWMQNALLGSARVLCVLSNAYLTSRSGFTDAEWTAAFRDDPSGWRGLLLPVAIERIERYGLLGPRVFLDLVGSEPGEGDLEQRFLRWIERSARTARPPFDADTRVRTTPQRIADWLRARRPRGLREFETTTEFSGFRAWLFAARLPYLSRITYRARDARHAGLTGEDELLDELLAPGRCGLVIAGRGGLGKTRLSLELAHGARERGWVVLRVTSACDPETLGELSHELDPNDGVLLLFDYLEQLPTLEPLCEEIERLGSEFGARLRFVGTCRPSFRNRVADGLFGTRILDLDGEQGAVSAAAEAEYRAAVTRHILASFGFAPTERHTELCREIPVLAVFLGWLREKRSGAEFESLLAEQDFARWVQRRIRSTFASDQATEEPLARLVAVLPIRCQADAALAETGLMPILDKLVADGWVDRDTLDDGTEAWTAAHDVFADQILIDALRARPASGPRLIGSIFELARRCGRPRSALEALARLAEHPVLAAVGWQLRLADDVAAHPDEWRADIGRVFDPTTLEPTSALALLRALPEARSDLVDDPSFQLSLGLMVRDFSSHADNGAERQATKAVLLDWLDRCLAQPTRGNFLLVSALRLDPLRYRDAALRAARTFARASQTQFVLSALLAGGVAPALLREVVCEWLERWATLPEASFVIQRWLDQGGERTLVEPSILAWLAVHCTRDQDRIPHDWASFVLIAWLDHGASPELALPHLTAWLGSRERAPLPLPAFGRLLAAWLERSADAQPVRSAADAWLNGAALARGAERRRFELLESRVLKGLLLSPPVRAEHRERARSWLHRECEASGLPPADVAQAWQHLLCAWLESGAERGAVEPLVTRWLRAHCSDDPRHPPREEARFVLRAWLGAGAALADVEPHLRAWLATHPSHPELDFLVKRWLEKGGEFASVREPALAWFRSHHTEAGAAFLAKQLAARKDLPRESVLDLLAWCRAHRHLEDAAWRLSQVFRQARGPKLAPQLVATAEQVLDAMIARDEVVPPFLRIGICVLVVDLASPSEKLPPELAHRGLALFAHWIRSPFSHVDDEAPVPPVLQTSRYPLAMARALTSGLLEARRDRDAITAALVWMLETWSPAARRKVAPQLQIIRDAIRA